MSYSRSGTLPIPKSLIPSGPQPLMIRRGLSWRPLIGLGNEEPHTWHHMSTGIGHQCVCLIFLCGIGKQDLWMEDPALTLCFSEQVNCPLWPLDSYIKERHWHISLIFRPLALEQQQQKQIKSLNCHPLVKKCFVIFGVPEASLKTPVAVRKSLD